MNKTILIIVVAALMSCHIPYMHAGNETNEPQIANVWAAGTVVGAEAVKDGKDANFFRVSEITEPVFARMKQGGSYPANCPIKREDLRYIQVLHYDYQGKIKRGELVCNKLIAQDLKEIFLELFRARYPIERVELVDNYKANDDASMRANNTSSFCYRTVSGTKTMSLHARGLAIDINPHDNPCVKYNANGGIQKIQPDTERSRKYANRASRLAHMINHEDLCYKVFVKHGFKWGGAWKNSKDFQHFEKKF